MKRETITIAGVTYPGKEALKREARRVLNDSVLDKPILEHDFMLGFYARHYAAESSPISCFLVKLHKLRPNHSPQRGFYALFDDGSEHCFGLYTCVSGERPSFHTQVAEAARAAVAQTVHDFKNKVFDGTCAGCGESLEYKDAHVDHYGEWSFVKILDAWCVFLKDRYPHIPIADGIASAEFADNKAADHFVRFHDKLAQLRVVCRKCNSPGSQRSTFEYKK